VVRPCGQPPVVLAGAEEHRENDADEVHVAQDPLLCSRAARAADGAGHRRGQSAACGSGRPRGRQPRGWGGQRERGRRAAGGSPARLVGVRIQHISTLGQETAIDRSSCRPAGPRRWVKRAVAARGGSRVLVWQVHGPAGGRYSPAGRAGRPAGRARNQVFGLHRPAAPTSPSPAPPPATLPLPPPATLPPCLRPPHLAPPPTCRPPSQPTPATPLATHPSQPCRQRPPSQPQSHRSPLTPASPAASDRLANPSHTVRHPAPPSSPVSLSIPATVHVCCICCTAAAGWRRCGSARAARAAQGRGWHRINIQF
jgi:hypothetical protein